MATNGFVVLGCDGSRLECPLAVALEELPAAALAMGERGLLQKL